MQRIWVFLVLLVLAGCKGCDDEIKPQIVIHLCDTLKEVSADFKVGFYADTGRGNEFFESDTVLGGPILFNASDPTAKKYEWWIGDETVAREGKNITVWFQGQQPGLLRVKLKVYRGGDTCFSPDKQVDSLLKFVRFISYRQAMAMFEGDYTTRIVQNPQDTFTAHCYWTDQKVNGYEPGWGGVLWLEYYLPGCTKKHYMTIGPESQNYTQAIEQVGGRFAAGREYSPEVGIGLQPDCSNGAKTIAGPVVFRNPKNGREINVKWRICPPGSKQYILLQFKGIKK